MLYFTGQRGSRSSGQPISFVSIRDNSWLKLTIFEPAYSQDSQISRHSRRSHFFFRVQRENILVYSLRLAKSSSSKARSSFVSIRDNSWLIIFEPADLQDSQISRRSRRILVFETPHPELQTQNYFLCVSFGILLGSFCVLTQPFSCHYHDTLVTHKLFSVSTPYQVRPYPEQHR